jgi:hypothetical protein
LALFCNPAPGGTFSSTAIEIIKWVTKFAVAQAKARVRVGRGILHVKGHNSVLRLVISKNKCVKKGYVLIVSKYLKACV